MNKELKSIMDDCNDINWLTAPASAAPTFEIAPELHSSPLFNTLPNDDGSLESFRQQGTTTPSSPPAPQQNTQTFHLISPPRMINSISKPSDETIAEDLTDDGNHTITSLASRMSLIESSLGQIASSLNLLAGQQNQNNVNNNLINNNESPASMKGAGAAP